MSILESVLVAITALRTNLLRSILTMLGIIIGVAAVITMVAMGAGAQKAVDSQIAALGTNLFLVMPGSYRDHGARMASGTRLRLTESDAHAIKREIPGVVAAAPTSRGAVQIVTGNMNWSTTVQGIDNDYLLARNWDIVEGRQFDSREIRSGARVTLMGATVAEELFGEASVVGQSVRINNVPFQIVGLLGPKGQSMGGSDQDDLIMVPLEAARGRLLGRSRAVAKAVSVIMVSVESASEMAEVKEQMTSLLRQRHRIRADQENTFSIRNMSEMVETRAETSRVFNMLLAAVASVSLVVGGIGIMNIMLVSVTERTREIGLRRAVGAKPRDILAQFLVEAVTLCMLGGAIGVLLSVLIVTVTSNLTGWPVQLSFEVAVMAVVFSAVIGVFFGYYPAKKAARQDPIESLRYE